MKKHLLIISAAIFVGITSCSEETKEIQSGQQIDNHTHEGHDANVDHQHEDHIHKAHKHEIQTGEEIDNHTHEGHDANVDHQHKDHIHKAHDH